MKKKMKAGLVIVVAIAAVMMLSSYAGAVTEEELIRAINVAEVDTYKYDMDMTVTTEMLMGNETNATEPMVMVMVMVVNGSGVVDNINKSMWGTMSTCMNMSEITEANTSVDTNGNSSSDMPGTIWESEMYIINYTMYMKMDMSSILPNQLLWLKSEMTEEDWESEDLLGPQMELLNCSTVTLLEDEEVKGVDCYVLKIAPDIEKYREIIMNQSIIEQAETGAEMIQDIPDVLNKSISNITMIEWVAKDKKFVMKAEAAIDMTMSPDTEEEAKVAMDYTMTFYDYNVPVSIVLPPEAEDATDISDLFGMQPG